MQKLRYILAVLRYLILSNGLYRIHSPFVYQLMKNVFYDKKKYPEYDIVESTRKFFLTNNSRIEVEDFGAGGFNQKKYFAKISDICRNSSRQKKYGRLLFRLARYFEPVTTIEFGTSLGISTLYLSMGYKHGKVITVEGAPEIYALANKSFSEMNIHNVEAINSDFDNIISFDKLRFENIGLIFLDGNHQKEATIRYFEYFMKLSANNTVIVLDDIHWSRGMTEAWEHIKRYPEVTLTIDIFTMGIVFFRKELSKQDFVIRFI